MKKWNRHNRLIMVASLMTAFVLMLSGCTKKGEFYFLKKAQDVNTKLKDGSYPWENIDAEELWDECGLHWPQEQYAEQSMNALYLFNFKRNVIPKKGDIMMQIGYGAIPYNGIMNFYPCPMVEVTIWNPDESVCNEDFALNNYYYNIQYKHGLENTAKAVEKDKQDLKFVLKYLQFVPQYSYDGRRNCYRVVYYPDGSVAYEAGYYFMEGGREVQQKYCKKQFDTMKKLIGFTTPEQFKKYADYKIQKEIGDITYLLPSDWTGSEYTGEAARKQQKRFEQWAKENGSYNENGVSVPVYEYTQTYSFNTDLLLTVQLISSNNDKDYVDIQRKTISEELHKKETGVDRKYVEKVEDVFLQNNIKGIKLSFLRNHNHVNYGGSNYIYYILSDSKNTYTFFFYVKDMEENQAGGDAMSQTIEDIMNSIAVSKK